MIITVEATVQNGQLKLKQPLTLAEGTKVSVTVTPVEEIKGPLAEGVIRCDNPALIEWAALDPELDFSSPRETS